MTTRAKLSVCVGLVALVAGVAFVWPRPAPQVQLSFVRYTNSVVVTGYTNSGAVIGITNRGTSAVSVQINEPDVLFSILASPRSWIARTQLDPGEGGQFVAWPVSTGFYIGPPHLAPKPKLPSSIGVRYWADSFLRLFLEWAG